MSDRDAVLEANAAFYAAFQSLDLKRMEEIWLRAPYIKCVHPGWGLLVGWGPVMESWERIFSGTLEMRFTLISVQAQVCGDFAWVVLTESIDSRHRDGNVEARACRRRISSSAATGAGSWSTTTARRSMGPWRRWSRCTEVVARDPAPCYAARSARPAFRCSSAGSPRNAATRPSAAGW